MQDAKQKTVLFDCRGTVIKVEDTTILTRCEMLNTLLTESKEMLLSLDVNIHPDDMHLVLDYLTLAPPAANPCLFHHKIQQPMIPVGSMAHQLLHRWGVDHQYIADQPKLGAEEEKLHLSILGVMKNTPKIRLGDQFDVHVPPNTTVSVIDVMTKRASTYLVHLTAAQAPDPIVRSKLFKTGNDPARLTVICTDWARPPAAERHVPVK